MPTKCTLSVEVKPFDTTGLSDVFQVLEVSGITPVETPLNVYCVLRAGAAKVSTTASPPWDPERCFMSFLPFF